jgi:hypothetical protein
VNKPSADLFTSYQTSQAQSTLFGDIIAVLMMVSVSVAVVQLGERIFPEWHGLYLVITTLLLAIEAMVSRKRAQLLEGREKVIFRISEWIAILVALKLLIYMVNGPEQLFKDLPLWEKDFIQSFFTGEYLLAIALAIATWINSAGFAGALERLYERDEDTLWDELGKLQNALNDVRRGISTRIFVMGAIVVLLAALSRFDATAIIRSYGKPPPGYNGPVINVLFYFILALVLLSQTQFALMRIRWLWQRLSMPEGLAKTWIKYGLLFFLALAIIVFFLPTEYSIGLFDTLRYVFQYLIQAVLFVLMLLAFPFTLCASLFRSPAAEQAPLPPPSTPPITPAAPAAQPIAWLEILKSLLFWIFFLGVIVFALRYYLSQNTALWKLLTSFPLFKWVNEAWKGLWKWVRRANRQLAGLVQEGFKRLRAQRVIIPTQAIRRFLNFNQLSPREKIIFFYVSMIELGGQQGITRKPSQTPYQYENRLTREIPEVNQDLHTLTDTFIEARYSQHPFEQPKAEQASSLWERIKAILKSWKREE